MISPTGHLTAEILSGQLTRIKRFHLHVIKVKLLAFARASSGFEVTVVVTTVYSASVLYQVDQIVWPVLAVALLLIFNYYLLEVLACVIGFLYFVFALLMRLHWFLLNQTQYF